MRKKKSLGQNFLNDEQILERIAQSVSVKPQSLIIEVGPGEGNLTEQLSKKDATIVAVELDDRLIPVLNKRFASHKNVHIVHDNILRIHISELVKKYQEASTNKGYSVVGNIPYYITSAIIRIFLESPLPPQEMVVMIQKEVAERIVAKPGEMSILSVAVQFYARAEMLFPVPKESFSPIPKVDSAVLKLVYAKKNIQDEQNFFQIVRAGFCARRKTLTNNLANSFHLNKTEVENWLNKASVPLHSRPQELSMDDWANLCRTKTIYSQKQ